MGYFEAMDTKIIAPKGLRHPDKFGKWLGYRLEEFDKENQKVTTSLEIREDHLSPSGRVHGGVISAFFDFSCGAAVFTTLADDEVCATIEIKVNYIQPLSLGDKLISKGEVIHRGKRTCVAQSFLYKEGDAKPAGLATATFNIVTFKP